MGKKQRTTLNTNGLHTEATAHDWTLHQHSDRSRNLPARSLCVHLARIRRRSKHCEAGLHLHSIECGASLLLRASLVAVRWLLSDGRHERQLQRPEGVS